MISLQDEKDNLFVKWMSQKLLFVFLKQSVIINYSTVVSLSIRVVVLTIDQFHD